MRIRFRYGKKYVASPRHRSVIAELWQGKRKLKSLGKVTSKAEARNRVISEDVREGWLHARNVGKTIKKRWDVAAVELAKKAVKQGIRKGDWVEVRLGRQQSILMGTSGGSSLRLIKTRKKGAKSLAEELTREMFRLAKLYYHIPFVDSDKLRTLPLPEFRIRKLRTGQIPSLPPKEESKSAHKAKRKATRKPARKLPRKPVRKITLGGKKNSTRKPARKLPRKLTTTRKVSRVTTRKTRVKKSPRSIRKTTQKVKPSYAVSRGGKMKRKQQSKRKRSTVKIGKRKR